MRPGDEVIFNGPLNHGEKDYYGVQIGDLGIVLDSTHTFSTIVKFPGNSQLFVDIESLLPAIQSNKDAKKHLMKR